MIPVLLNDSVEQDIVHGLGQLSYIDFTVLVFIGTAGVIQRGDAVLFIAIQPGADGAPGEAVEGAGDRVREGLRGNVFDFVAGRGAGCVGR